MKKVFAVFAILVGLQSFAQDQIEKQNQEPQQPRTEKSDVQVAKMTSELNLNDKQAAAFKKILEEQRKTREAKMGEFKSKKEERNSMNRQDKIAMFKEIKANKEKLDEKMKAILNPEQYTKWSQMQAERKQKMREKMKEQKALNSN